VVRIAIFSTCALAATGITIASAGKHQIDLDFIASPVPDQERNPSANHYNIQQDTERENHLHRRFSSFGRTSPNEPDLVSEGCDGHGKKERLQPLKPDLASGAQER
jgi:hypothetical protein